MKLVMQLISFVITTTMSLPTKKRIMKLPGVLHDTLKWLRRKRLTYRKPER